MHAVLKRFAAQTGAQLPMTHHLVQPYRFHAQNHTSEQAVELQPWELVNILFLMSRARGSHKVLLGWLVMAAVFCIRWEHLQRSQFVAAHKGWLQFCAQGKSRKQARDTRGRCRS